MNSSSTVTAELGISLIVPREDVVVPLTAGISYSSGDPYAVRLSLHVGLDEPVEWIFARELLFAGLRREEGLGDVRVWPSVRSHGGLPGMVVNIELSSSRGHANLEVPLREVSDFLQRSYALVPVGRENRHVDVDAEFWALMHQSS